MNVEATVARTRHTITVGDGTEIFFKDWGTGQPIVFSHGSPLNSDAWEDQMVFLADPGVPLHCARSTRSRAIQPTLDRQ